MTADTKLLQKLRVARTLVFICVAASAIPIVLAIYRFLTLPERPKSVGIIFLLVPWWPVVLFPLVGFILAQEWKESLTADLREVQERNEKQRQPPAF